MLLHSRTVVATVLGAVLAANTPSAMALATGTGSDDQTKVSRRVRTKRPATECRVILLKNANCVLVAKHVRALFENDGDVHKVTWYEPTNAVLLRAMPFEIKQLEFLISSLDAVEKETEEEQETARPEPTTTKLFQIKHAAANEVGDVLYRVVERDCRCRTRSRGKCGCFKAHFDARTNILIVRGTATQLRQTGDLIEVLDVPIERP